MELLLRKDKHPSATPIGRNNKVPQDIYQFQGFSGSNHSQEDVFLEPSGDNVQACQFCHIVRTPRDEQENIPVDSHKTYKCLVCDKDYVPEVIIATINPPDKLHFIGKPQLLEARVVLPKKNGSRFDKTDKHAQQISEKAFFVEYYLHYQLLTKLKIVGKNALFCLRSKIEIGPNMITGVATATAVCLRALPLSKPLMVQMNDHSLVKASTKVENRALFDTLEKLSRFNTQVNLSEKICSIQSPYNYFKELPKHRAVANLIDQQQIVVDNKTKKPSLKLSIDLGDLMTIQEHSDEKTVIGNEATRNRLRSSIVAGEVQLKEVSEEENPKSIEQKYDNHLRRQMTKLPSIGADDSAIEIVTETSNQDQEENILVLLTGKEAENVTPLDLSCLTPTGTQSQQPGRIKFRSGSREEQRDIETLIKQTNEFKGNNSDLSPSLLVIKERLSFDEQVKTQLEVDTYKLQNINTKGLITLGRRETILNYNPLVMKNKRGQLSLTQNEGDSDNIMNTINYYNDNKNFNQYEEPSPLFHDDQKKSPHLDSKEYFLKKMMPKLHHPGAAANFIVEVDDSKDIDLLKGLVDPVLPPDVVLINSMYDLINYNWQKVSLEKIMFYNKLFRFQINTKIGQDSLAFTRIWQGAYMELVSDLRKNGLTPCIFCALRMNYKIHGTEFIDIFFSGSLLGSNLQADENEQNQNSTFPKSQSNSKKSDYHQHYFTRLALKERKLFDSQTMFTLPEPLFKWLEETGERIILNEDDIQIPEITYRQPSVKGSQTMIPKTQLTKKKKNPFMQFFCGNKSKKGSGYDSADLQYSVKKFTRDNIKLLPMSVFPSVAITEYFGLVDVHLVRRFWFNANDNFAQAVEDLIADLSEIVKSRVEALGGNCLTGYHVDINSFEQKSVGGSDYEASLIVSATGDAAFIETADKQ